MKINTLFALAALFALGLLVSACDKSTGPVAVTDAQLVGKWNVTSADAHASVQMHFTYPMVKDSTETMDTTVNFPANACWTDFKADHYFVAVMANDLENPSVLDTGSGTWSIAGNQVTIIDTADNDTLNFASSISGTSLSMIMSMNEADTTNIPGIVIVTTVVKATVTYHGTKAP